MAGGHTDAGGSGSAALASYRAFVSYSHADTDAARRLQRRLEVYRVPRRLAKRVSPLGRTHGGVGPIFRDREDFPASADLSASVRLAISRSLALVVLCSPDAARSIWVAREIALFRAIHPDRPVLAALIAGEPAESFPQGLHADGLEPVAADFRRTGDGPRLAFLKVVAGILGIPLDELIQRDAQRRQRRVMAVTAASVAAMLVLTAVTFVAITARHEAERRRTAAEGLVELILTDVRPRLEQVGRLDIMRAMNASAMRYYEEQGAPELLPDDSLERRARVIGEMGEDAENSGKLDLAERRYQLLYRTTRVLLDTYPGDPARILAHAWSENRLAVVAVTRGHLAQALVRLQRVERMLRDTAGWGRRRPDWLRLAALSHGNVCAALLVGGKEALRALAACRQAVGFGEEYIRAQPDDEKALYDRVFHYLWLAAAERKTGRRRRTGSDRYLAFSEALVASDPKNRRAEEQRVEVYIKHAAFLRGDCDRAGARAFLRKAYPISETLVEEDPGNASRARLRAHIIHALQRRDDHGCRHKRS